MSKKNNAIQLKHRVIHAMLYESILLVIGIPLLSVLLASDLTHTGTLWIMMSITAVLWNIMFNAGFERIEQALDWTQRTIAIRIVHALGVEGGILLFTVPMIAWMLDMSLLDALLLDIGLATSIVCYTFLYQWIYDVVSERYF